ncbi:lipocalin-like [Antennarius striatus]|uniref:lipocalin-like n=1 Tax=Antennarius striatus TaxID=241820 RepID=UPI0035B4E4A0
MPRHFTLILFTYHWELSAQEFETMRNLLLRMMSVLLCVLATRAEVLPVEDFNVTKVAGKWYMTAFATNAAWYVNNKDALKIGTAMFEPTEAGDLHMSYANLKNDGSCWRLAHLANKTDTPGRFVYISEIWKNYNDMSFVDVDYDQYALIHTIKTIHTAVDVLNNLFTRTPVISDALKQNFTQFSLDSGISPENIVILAENDECPQN